MKMPMCKTVLSILFFVICVVGLLFQVHQVSEGYFRYKTTSKINIQVQEVEEFQTLVYCPRYVDLLNRTNYKEYGLYQKLRQEGYSLHDELAALKIKNILNLTPSSHGIVSYCGVINDSIATTTVFPGKECETKIFYISRSVNGERICYTIKPRKRRSYSVGNCASSITDMNIVYYLKINSSILDDARVSIFISYYVDPEAPLKFPLYSRFFGEKIKVSKQQQ